MIPREHSRARFGFTVDSFAFHTRLMAEHYGVPVILHSGTTSFFNRSHSPERRTMNWSCTSLLSKHFFCA